MTEITFSLFDWLWLLASVPCAYFFYAINEEKKSRVKATNILFQKYDAQKEELADLRVHVAEKYVMAENMQRLETQILSKLDRIEKKIDAKADK